MLELLGGPLKLVSSTAPSSALALAPLPAFSKHNS